MCTKVCLYGFNYLISALFQFYKCYHSEPIWFPVQIPHTSELTKPKENIISNIVHYFSGASSTASELNLCNSILNVIEDPAQRVHAIATTNTS